MQPKASGRVLAAVLFTDMVDSTAVAEELGDRRWKALVDQHHRLIRRELKRFGGRELDTAGDGFFASFGEPASAIACACAAADAVRDLGIEIRAGVHFGECERIGKKLGGITVVVGARVMALGGAGDVLVSGTAAELARGADFSLADRGMHALKGVDGEWRVFSVDTVDGAVRPTPLDADEAARRRAGIEPEGGSRRLRAPLFAVIAVAALATAFVLYVATRSGEPAPPGPDTLVRIDAEGEGFDSVLPIADAAYPNGVASGDGDLWVINVANRTLMRLDPESSESETFGTSSPPTGIAFVDGKVWVTHGFTADPQRRVEMLDPRDRVLAPSGITLPDGSYPIAARDDALWIADPLGSSVLRYDPVSRETDTVTLPEGSGPIALGVDDGSPYVWVAAGRVPAVFRLDARDLDAPIERFSTGDADPTALAVADDGSIWLVQRDADTVLALAENGTTRIDVAIGDRCDAPTAVSAAGGSIWVSCAGSSNVVRLDPSDGSVIGSLAVGGEPGPMTPDGSGATWVTIRGPA